MADLFMMPGKMISGAGALRASQEAFRELGSKALVVADPAMEPLGNLKQITDMLDEIHIPYAVFDGITGEPDDRMIEEGALRYQTERCDFLIGLGGGSAMDAMKAIGLLAAWGGTLAEALVSGAKRANIPMAAVPTTAGTGSEATQFAVITNRRTQVKMLLKGPGLMPDLAVIDPRFTATVPRTVTAATGIDALTHAIEAYTSKQAQPMSDLFAVSACRRIFKNLKAAWENGEDPEHRSQMAAAALEAGIAFNNSSVTLVHGMSRPLGALFHIPHGLSNAMLLNVCLRYAAGGAPNRFARLAVACGFAKPFECPQDAAEKLLACVAGLLRTLEIPTPAEYGIDREAFMEKIPKMAADAFASGSPANTRREIDPPAMERLYLELWRQEENRE